MHRIRAGPSEGKWLVISIIKGEHGPYAVASHKGEPNVTFFLKKHVWVEKDLLEPGQYVFLSDFREKRAGWRAYSARFWRPKDEYFQSNEQ